MRAPSVSALPSWMNTRDGRSAAPFVVNTVRHVPLNAPAPQPVLLTFGSDASNSSVPAEKPVAVVEMLVAVFRALGAPVPDRI